MISSRRIVEVAGEKASLVDQRFDGYREDMVRCLMRVIMTQSDGLSERGRRDRVSKEVEALGAKVIAKTRAGA